MEIYSLPLRVVVSMWIIQHIKKPHAAVINVDQHLTGQIESINNVMRIENPLREIGWFENIFRRIVAGYRSGLIKERCDLRRLNITHIGFIKKGDNND